MREIQAVSASFKGKIKENLQHFVTLINQASLRYESESAFDVTKFILEKSGYLAALKEEKTEGIMNQIKLGFNQIREKLNLVSDLQGMFIIFLVKNKHKASA